MGLQAFVPDETGVRERVIAYSYSGFGKSRFITSLPEDKYGQMLMFCGDENAHLLGSVLPAYRKRVIPLRPLGDDPIENFTEFAVRDWREHYPGVKTLLVDTYSSFLFKIIRHCANMGMMTQEKHYLIGKPGQKGSQAIPNRSDYFAVQSVSRGFLDTLFENQTDMHIIFAMHEDITLAEGVGAVSGPSHPGRTMALELPGKFDTVVRLTREPEVTPDGDVRMRVYANTSSNGQFIAKLREAGANGNPIPKVALDNDPINFWKQYDALNNPQPEEASK